MISVRRSPTCNMGVIGTVIPPFNGQEAVHVLCHRAFPPREQREYYARTTPATCSTPQMGRAVRYHSCLYALEMSRDTIFPIHFESLTWISQALHREAETAILTIPHALARSNPRQLMHDQG
jgi:hypothetical protein